MTATEMDVVGHGAGDRNLDYVWGSPRQYLTLIAQARLTVLRGLIMDYRHGERGGAADGDLSYTEAGLHVPLPTESEPNPNESDCC